LAIGRELTTLGASIRSDARVILYDFWRSSSAWRVRLALHIKAIAFERRVVNLAAADGGEQHAAEFRALNPLGQVPVLVVDDGRGGMRPIGQSMAILAYLEETYPQKPLLPSEPWLRARARQMAEMINAGIQPFQNIATHARVRALSGDPTSWTQHFIASGLGALEATARETAATFLVGDDVSWADVLLVPQLYAARRFRLDLAPYPTLLRAEASAAALPAFGAAAPNAQTDAVKT
jgi:maleylacetoacetate isomerase